jgi:hypothetical protein
MSVANPSTQLGPASSTVAGLNRGGSRSSRICDQIQTSIVTRGASQKHKALMLWSLPYTAKICGGASADLPISRPVVLCSRSGRRGVRGSGQSVFVPLDVRQVDPRDQMWEVYDPEYRVYFWDVDLRSDEWELARCDVQEALQWAQESADGRNFTLYAVAVGPEGLGLIRLLGADPTRT